MVGLFAGLLADCLAFWLVCLFVRRVKITQGSLKTDFDQTWIEDWLLRRQS